MDAGLHGSLPKLRAACGKTQQTPASSGEGKHSSKDISSGRRRWAGWGEVWANSGESRGGFTGADVPVPRVSQRDRGLCVLAGHQAMSPQPLMVLLFTLQEDWEEERSAQSTLSLKPRRVTRTQVSQTRSQETRDSIINGSSATRA